MSDKNPIEINYNEPNMGTPPGSTNLEEIYGNLPQVTTTPTWIPRKFKDAFALDTTTNKLYYYDFTNTVWKNTGGSGSPGGSDTSVQYNDGGSFGGDANLTWDKTRKVLAVAVSITTPEIDAPPGDDLNLIATGGGGVLIQSGDSTGSTDGGTILILGGSPDGAGNHVGDLFYDGAVGSDGADGVGDFIVSGYNAEHHLKAFQKTTSDATPADLKICTVQSGYGVLVEAHVVAIRTGGTSGTSGDGAGYVLRAMYSAVTGTLTLIGSVQQDFVVESQPAWDATLVLSGSDISVRVTGAADNTISWVASVRLTAGAGGIPR